ncbi:MAG: endolytic transglycosylase MltG [bacterium]
MKVTIQEGIWQSKLAKIFEEELKINAGEIMQLSSNRKFINKLGLYGVNNLEGYLLPDTYFFYKNSSAENVLTKLKNEMDKLFDEKAVNQMDKLGMSKKAILTLASIIDGESNRFDEFRTIAGVYYNRLKKGIKLQADPTIQYLKRDGKRFNRILYRDLEIDSPYNTYLYAGLPPTPINNPGKEAVLAALYPEENDYLYFVADGSGGHTFSKTYNEHQYNVYNYRVWRSTKDTL